MKDYICNNCTKKEQVHGHHNYGNSNHGGLEYTHPPGWKLTEDKVDGAPQVWLCPDCAVLLPNAAVGNVDQGIERAPTPGTLFIPFEAEGEISVVSDGDVNQQTADGAKVRGVVFGQYRENDGDGYQQSINGRGRLVWRPKFIIEKGGDELRKELRKARDDAWEENRQARDKLQEAEESKNKADEAADKAENKAKGYEEAEERVHKERDRALEEKRKMERDIGKLRKIIGTREMDRILKGDEAPAGSWEP